MEFLRAISAVCIIDAGQITIPVEMHNQLGWQPGDNLDIISNKKFRFLELIKRENGRLNVDSYGRVAIPDDYLYEMHWGDGHQVTARLNVEAGSVSLLRCRM